MCATDCVLVGLDWPEPMMLFILHVTCSCILMHMFFPFNIFFDIFWTLFGLFWLISLSLSLPFSVYVSLLLWHPNVNLLHPKTLFVLGHLLLLISPPFSVQFHDEKAKSDFFENFSRWGVHSKHRVILSDFSNTDLPTVIHSRGWKSLCDISVTCPSVLIQKFYSNIHGIDSSVPLFITRVWGTRIVVTPDIVSEVLHILRVKHPDYPGCERLRTVSKDELVSAFYKRPLDWGKCQFTYYSSFTKGPRFFNMVMTFVLHPPSHYNSITEPCARFLLFLLEHLTIDFPFHFILSIIDVYRDTATRDKLIFPSAITRLLCHFNVLFPSSKPFHVMGAIDAGTVKRSKAQFRLRHSGMVAPPIPSAPSTSAPSTSAKGVTLDAIMA